LFFAHVNNPLSKALLPDFSATIRIIPSKRKSKEYIWGIYGKPLLAVLPPYFRMSLENLDFALGLSQNDDIVF
ncbi:MAG: hypothetical protein J6Y95_06160, partial [Lachnospiraceae bacterium]|nr:hypothetical protein [Lachnospiraceae bacterium]